MIEHELKYTGKISALGEIFNRFSETKEVKVESYVTRYYDTPHNAFFAAGYQLRQFSDKVELKGLDGLSRPEIKVYTGNFTMGVERLHSSVNWPVDAPKIPPHLLEYKGAIYTQRATSRGEMGLYGLEAEMAFDMCEHFNRRGQTIGKDHEIEIELDVLPLHNPQFALENWVYTTFWPHSGEIKKAASKLERMLDFGG